MTEQNVILESHNLKKYFPIRTDFFGRPTTYLKAVDGISLSVKAGTTLGLVGESGCGKSTVGKTLIRLYRPTEGDILFQGKPISSRAVEKELRRDMQMIFQDPYASLNPRMTIGDIIGEPIDIHHLASGSERTERIIDLLHLVGLNAAYRDRFPHEFSGGQRQRIGIARALAVNPRFIICDEPISALDVSIQAQIINLLERLQEELGLTYLFIAHDLAMVKHISDQVAVMYLGKIVETAASEELFQKPLHPYTQALLSAIPAPDPDAEAQRKRIPLIGEVPSPVNPPSGCSFRTRCPHALPVCADETPLLAPLGAGHQVACHLVSGI